MTRQFSSEEIVTAIYQFFVHREPDEGGFSDFVTALDGGERLEEVMKRAAQSEEFKSRLYDFLSSLA